MTERPSIFKVPHRAAKFGRRGSPEIDPTCRDQTALVGLRLTGADLRPHMLVMGFGPDRGVSLAADTIEGR